MSQRKQKVKICRKISFSSGHRYYNPALTEEENRELYGSSYSERGLGHNFVLEAVLEGNVDPQTGMVVNLKDVDRILKKVTDPLDHHFLNTDIENFQSVVPTPENLATYCFREISREIGGEPVRLLRVRLHEGPDFWVDCEACDD